MKSKKVKYSLFSFVEKGELTELDKERLRTRIKQANSIIKHEYENNPDNPIFDEINHSVFMLSGSEKIGAPTIPIPRKWTIEKANELLDIVSFVKEGTQISDEYSQNLDTVFNNINRDRELSRQDPLTQLDKQKLLNVFRSSEWKKLTEIKEFGSKNALNQVEKMLASSTNDKSITTGDITRILGDYIKLSDKQRSETSLTGFVDDEIYKLQH